MIPGYPGGYQTRCWDDLFRTQCRLWSPVL